MISRASLLSLLSTTFLFACSGAPDDVPAASDESASTAQAVIHAHTVKKLGPTFARPVQGLDTEADARALVSKLEDDARETAQEDCAATLALPLGAVQTRLVGLAPQIAQDPGDGRWGVAAQSQQTYCSSASLEDAVLVTFDGQLRVADATTLRAGGKMLLDAGLDRVIGDVSDLGHVAATKPHLMARFDGGAFAEVSGLGGVDGKKGGTVDVEAPFPDDALLVDIASAADRFEMFFRVERWNVSGFFEDGNFTGTLVSRAPDGFVSNFGANYRVPVVK
ncbi:MAG TPA: hypothetical protein VIF62_27785 [Labilithrix sp.]|jgi:hypothetical protein